MRYIRRKSPDGYKELLVYKRATELQDFIYQITENFQWTEKRRKEHMRDSARSVKQNIVEGWKRETTQQYIDFLSYSFGSLGELKEDSEDCIKFGLINQEIFQELMRRCGELDYLMGRLKQSLEIKISKEETLSPYQKWLAKEMDRKTEKDRKIDEELRKILEESKKERGEKEEKGEMGEKGERGEGIDGEGISGEKGERDEKEEKGEMGEKGERGEGIDGEGISGEKGEKGERGEKEEKGEMGERDEKGESEKGERDRG